MSEEQKQIIEIVGNKSFRTSCQFCENFIGEVGERMRTEVKITVKISCHDYENCRDITNGD